MTGEQDGVPECDWAKLAVADGPAGEPGDVAVFWSNKVHRGPGTEPGEERLVLFCAWQLVGRRAGNNRESETDYNFYDTHLEPKLRLSQRAARGIKRQRAGR